MRWREHLERMIGLTLPGSVPGAVSKSVATLSTSLLRQLDGRIEQALEQGTGKLDPCSSAHLEDARTRIRLALDAVYVYR